MRPTHAAAWAQVAQTLGDGGGFPRTAEHPERLRNLRPGGRVGRTHRRGPGVALEGPLAVFQSQQGGAPPEVRRREAGIERNRGVIAGQGVLQTIQGEQHRRAAVDMTRRLGLQGRRPAKAGQRLLQPPEPAQRVAAAGVGLREAWLGGDRRIVARQGFLCPPQLAETVAAVDQGLGVGGTERDRPLEADQGLAKAPKLEKQRAQKVVRSGDPGVGLGRAPQELQGFVGAAVTDPQASEPDQGVGAVAILPQRPGVVLSRFLRAARRFQSPSLLEQDVRQSLGLSRMGHGPGIYVRADPG